MKIESINGRRVPYELSINALAELCTSQCMEDFAVACEALSTLDNCESYRILKSYLGCKDKYRRLIALKAIHKLSASKKLTPNLEALLHSKDVLFVHAASEIIVSKRIGIPNDVILDTLHKYIDDASVGQLVIVLKKDEASFNALISIFKRSHKCLYQEIICEYLYSNYRDEKPEELFLLFRESPFGKIRCYAVMLGKAHGLDLSGFLTDTDGHVRKLISSSKR